MKLQKTVRGIFYSLLIFFNACIAFAGGDGKPVEAINKKIPTEGLGSFSLFIVNLYNNNRILFAFLITLTMVVLGLIIAYGTDLIIKPKSRKAISH